MLVNEDIIEQLCIDAGSTRTQKARKYQMMGKVVITKVEYENQTILRYMQEYTGQMNMIHM